jgi:hypothetical protein
MFMRRRTVILFGILMLLTHFVLYVLGFAAGAISAKNVMLLADGKRVMITDGPVTAISQQELHECANRMKPADPQAAEAACISQFSHELKPNQHN